MARGRTYSDEQLAVALTASRSWRGVLRHLGLAATSSGAMASVRRHADRLGIDYTHLGSRRPRPDERSRTSVSHSGTSSEADGRPVPADKLVATEVAAAGSRRRTDTEHSVVERPSTASSSCPDASRLSRAGPLLAAAWFTLCGDDVSWPLEPCRYDLMVSSRRGVRRVQVKTTTTRAGATWKVYLSTSRQGRTTYGASEIDDFFIIDGDLNYYVIPVDVVGGLHAIHLSVYEHHRVAPLVPVA